MSTRKLILTALVCGLVIMLAGGFKLLQISSDETEVRFLPAGETATLGDMTVSVLSVAQPDDATLVTVSMSGVDGEGAAEGWRLVSAGEAVLPLAGSDLAAIPDTDPTLCRTTSVDVVTTCVVAFPASTGTVTVAYLRAGNRAQWAP